MRHNIKAKNLKFRDNLSIKGYKPKYFKNGFCVTWNLAKNMYMVEYCESVSIINILKIITIFLVLYKYVSYLYNIKLKQRTI